MFERQARRRRHGAAVPLVAALAVLVFVAAGCGKSADQKANETYADGVCTAIGNWETQVKNVATSITAGSLSKEGLQSKLAQIQSDTASLKTQIKAVPAPNTSDGNAAKQQINKLSTELATTLSSVKSAIAQIPSGASAVQIASALAPLAPQVTSLASTADSTVTAVENAGGSLSDAFKSTDSCKSLTSSG
jgi:phage shock protein A